jgi:hypothetical protein
VGAVRLQEIIPIARAGQGRFAAQWGTVTREALGVPGNDLIVGTVITVPTIDGDCVFRVNVQYLPEEPKRKRVPVILEPLEIYGDLWEYEGYERI